MFYFIINLNLQLNHISIFKKNNNNNSKEKEFVNN